MPMPIPHALARDPIGPCEPAPCGSAFTVFLSSLVPRGPEPFTFATMPPYSSDGAC
jgi:hypothetical protein